MAKDETSRKGERALKRSTADSKTETSKISKEDTGKLERPIKRSTADVTSSKTPDVDLYAKVVNLEDTESKERNADEDANLYSTTCRAIEKLLREIAELKKTSLENSQAEIKEKGEQAQVKVMLLKKLNRLEKTRMKESRDVLQKQREQVDCDHLHLQNLVYENVQLSKEVKKCYDFKSTDEELELIPVEEFYASAPTTVSKEELTKNNPHELRIARLNWELSQRKSLAEKLKKLETTKDALTKDIELRKKQFNSLGPQLKPIIESTKPLQTLLKIRDSKLKKMHELALLLPRPLYVLYVQAEAYSQIVKWLTVSIVGKEEEARVLEDHYEPIPTDSSDSDMDEDEEETSHRRKKTKDRRIPTKTESTASRREKCLKQHALCVQLALSMSRNENLIITFKWLLTLEIVTVVAALTGGEPSGIAAADLFRSRDLLSSMYPGDTGEVSPNASSDFHLRAAGLEEFPVDEGVPYRWAQTLCGLSFPQQLDLPSVKISQLNMESTLKVIRERTLSRIALAKEVKSIASGEAFQANKFQAQLTSLTAVTFNDLNSFDNALFMEENGVIDSSHFVYRANIDVNGAKISAYISIPPTYPESIPIIFLQVPQTPPLTSSNNNHLRDIEREVNAMLQFENDKILLHQMHTLMQCVEVFTATELSPDRAVDVKFFRRVMGRKRSHPYRYLDAARGIFTHDAV